MSSAQKSARLKSHPSSSKPMSALPSSNTRYNTRATTKSIRNDHSINSTSTITTNNTNANDGTNSNLITSHQSVKLKRDTTTDVTGIWFEIFTKQMFKNFQRSIYPIITSIINNTEHSNHPFTKQWYAMQCKQPIHDNTTFATLKRVFQFEDVKSYAAFLQQCPDFERYILIRSSNQVPHGFEFGLLNQEKSHIMEYHTQYPQAMHDYSIAVVLHNDHPDPQEFQLLINIVTRLFQEFIVNYPDEEYSQLCRTWIDEGLSTINTFQDLNNLMDCMTTKELYNILITSAALQENAYLQWTADSLHLYLHRDYDSIKTIPIPTGDYNYIQHEIHLQYFHNLVFQTIVRWSTQMMNTSFISLLRNGKTPYIRGCKLHQHGKKSDHSLA
jgi:hypothetical protein